VGGGNMGKRENVWLGVAGVVINGDGNWLVVKKRYGGLKGSWSFPAGFMDEGETADQAVLREVLEETGISCKVEGLIGLRTGVIKNSVSDNLLVFLLNPLPGQTVVTQESELFEAKYMNPHELKNDPATSVLLHYFLDISKIESKPCLEGMDPGAQFRYSSYKLFL
jgi:8-oxo-dGTP pyrophosphatase MutT (NUDIX family)